jgi:septal ring factor EnvC (AmiA/AmiB activator)
MEISEKAEQIQKNLGKLSTSLKDVEKEWNTLYDHIKKHTTKPAT